MYAAKRANSKNRIVSKQIYHDEYFFWLLKKPGPLWAREKEGKSQVSCRKCDCVTVFVAKFETQTDKSKRKGSPSYDNYYNHNSLTIYYKALTIYYKAASHNCLTM